MALFVKRLFSNKSDTWYLLVFFVLIISAGALVLFFLGLEGGGRIGINDAFFTSASAVCNVGLTAAAVSSFTFAGQFVILLLIQIGGLGIISFSVIMLTIPGKRFTLARRATIQSYYLDGVEYNPRKIVRNIAVLTLAIEFTGAIMLAALFWHARVESPVFNGIFHSVSAFCNTGLSPLDDQLESFFSNIPVILIISSLIFLGGMGFIVLHDILRLMFRKKRRLSYHSKVVLGMSTLIAAAGTAFFYFFERGGAFAGSDFFVSLANAFCQTINTRSGGFEFFAQDKLSSPSKFLTSIMMMTGGAPGSIAGGIKITVLFILFSVMIKRPDLDGDITVFKRRIKRAAISSSSVYFVKAVFLLLLFVLMLSVSEGLGGASIGRIFFEAASAFGTAGLSLGLTGELSNAGKWIIIAAMFCGRVGLVALAFPVIRKNMYEKNYPEGTLLLGQL